MATRTRSTFKLAAYADALERFNAALEEATYRQQAGLEESVDLQAIYAEHAALFDETAIDNLRRAAGANGDEAAQAAEMLRFAIEQNVAGQVADLTERIDTAEATAVVVWRGEHIPYRAVWNRAADISGRAERNGLAASHLEAVEAINPLRQQRFERMSDAVRALGYADVTDMVRQTAGFDPQELAASIRGFMVESETVYFAALRRNLAEIDIEQGDASLVDLHHVLRGAGWDPWFDARGLLDALRLTTVGMGMDLEAMPNVTLDTEDRPAKSPRAFCVTPQVPGDVRLVIKRRGGWDDYGALLHEAGHALHFSHVAPDLPVAYRLLGDASVTEGYAFVIEMLIGDPAWLQPVVGMSERDALAFADFHAFWNLAQLRRLASQLLYELYLHHGVDASIAREQFAGLLGVGVGVSYPSETYLSSVDDHLYAARYLRAAEFQGALSAWLRAKHGEAWWRSVDAADSLRRSWSRGQQWNAQDVVAHLGYDELDWRPVLRQIRTLLIGEMSGYGGPNITTRAGTRKV